MKIFLLISIITVLNIPVKAQEANKFEFNDLRTPSSPGFILLDESPSSIDRPTTPQGLAVSLLQGTAQGGSLEIAPFWLTDHINFTTNDLVSKVVPFIETFSVSVSSSRTELESIYSVGARTQVLKLMSRSQKDTIAFKISELKLILDEDPDDINENDLKSISEELSKLIQAPTFVVEVAGAIVGTSNQNNYSDLVKARSGIWGSLSYNPTIKFPLSIIGLLRIIDNPNFGEYSDDTQLLDFGSRIFYNTTKLGISGEFILRNQLNGDQNNYHRLSGIVEYKLLGNFYATASLGKNFNDINNIIALIGINFGFSSNSNLGL